MPKHDPPPRGSSHTKLKKGVNTKVAHNNIASDEDIFEFPSQNLDLPFDLLYDRDRPERGIMTQEALEDLLGRRSPLPPTDAELEERYKALKIAVWHWAIENFSGAGPNASVVFDLLRLSQNHPELAEYLNFLVSCPQDETWEQFFNSRRAYLAFAMLGKVLEVHVFGQEMFGATEAQLKVLRSVDLEMMHLDGFTRQATRASIINGFLSAHDKALPPNFLSALTDLQARVATLVTPLQQPPSPPSPFHQSLSYILLTAARLSLDVRREPSTIYYMRPVFKETVVDSDTTHLLNMNQLVHDDLYREDHQRLIVRIAAWPIVDAYRAGTGREDGEDGGDGIRVRRVCMGEAYAEWGSFAPQRMRARYQDKAVGESGSAPKAAARASLREDLGARRGRINLPTAYYASGVGIILSFLALGASNHATKFMQSDVAQRVIHTAATFRDELAAGAGTLEEVVSDAVRKMVDAGWR